MANRPPEKFPPSTISLTLPNCQGRPFKEIAAHYAALNDNEVDALIAERQPPYPKPNPLPIEDQPLTLTAEYNNFFNYSNGRFNQREGESIADFIVRNRATIAADRVAGERTWAQYYPLESVPEPTEGSIYIPIREARKYYGLTQKIVYSIFLGLMRKIYEVARRAVMKTSNGTKDLEESDRKRIHLIMYFYIKNLRDCGSYLPLDVLVGLKDETDLEKSQKKILHEIFRVEGRHPKKRLQFFNALLSGGAGQDESKSIKELNSSGSLIVRFGKLNRDNKYDIILTDYQYLPYVPFFDNVHYHLAFGPEREYKSTGADCKKGQHYLHGFHISDHFGFGKMFFYNHGSKIPMDSALPHLDEPLPSTEYRIRERRKLNERMKEQKIFGTTMKRSKSVRTKKSKTRRQSSTPRESATHN